METNDLTMVFSPYIPLIYDYWPFVLTGVLCFLAAVVLFKTSLDDAGDDYIPPESSYLDDPEFYTEEEEKLSEVCGLPVDLKHVPLEFTRLPGRESEARSAQFFDLMDKRRTVRFFSPDPVPIEVIRNIIRAAGTAPSGAHTEPWTYVVVIDPDMKQKIRETIEAEEKVNYEQRLGTRESENNKELRMVWEKDYLSAAPYIIMVFKQTYSIQEDGTKKLHYYNEMSVAIAAGILLTAIHYAGLVSLTSTPMNCSAELREILKRPKNEKLTLVVPVGYPAQDATVPDLTRKHLHEIMVEI